jgi:pilus assembly protein Flp/PilA
MTMFHYWKTLIATHLAKSEKGQDLAEYGMLLALIALIVIVGVTLLGNNLLTFFNKIGVQVGGW